MNLYIGNLDYKANEDSLNDLFSEHGTVTSVKIITDKYSGESKGFAFVEMENSGEAQAAIDELNGSTFMKRELVVNEARPRT
ncbi:MAG: RNA-binding protein [Bacteroidales bacterium]|nr:RNA-binding protein [Bacteroidales bacterium]